MKRFEVTILGSASATPTSSKITSAQLVNAAERFVLLDCGEGTQIQLRRLGLNMQGIDIICITHMHGDHYLGLIGLLQSMHLLGRKNSLILIGPPELKTVIDVNLMVSDTRLNYEIEYRFYNPLASELIYEDKSIEIINVPLKHRVKCCGYLINEKPSSPRVNKFMIEKYNLDISDIHRIKAGLDLTLDDGTVLKNEDLILPLINTRSYAYISDSIYLPSICETIKDVDLLYHEATFTNGMKERAIKTFHSTAEEAALIAKQANAKALLIGHFSSRYKNADEHLLEAKVHFENTIEAVEGKMYKIEITKD